jgi:hypothetical protein
MAEYGALISAGVALLGAGAGVIQGENARGDAKKAQARQSQAQQTALGAAAAESRRASVEQASANREQPNPAAILAAEQQRRGGRGTLLTGAGGVDPGSLVLGRNTLLGQ